MSDQGHEQVATAAPEFQLDERTERGFVQWYRSLPKDAQIVRFFDRKGYYSVHADNALFVARQFYKTTAVVKYHGNQNDPLPGVTLNRNLFESVLRELLLEGEGHTVEVYEGSGSSWKMIKSASPGRLSDFEEELFKNSDGDAPVVMAVMLTIQDSQRQVGIAYVDAATRSLGGAEFVDDEQFCGLEAIIVQLGAKECVLPKDLLDGSASSSAPGGDTTDARRLKDVLARCGTMATARPRTFFSLKHVETDLSKLVKGGSMEHHADVMERKSAAACLAAVVAFTELMSDPSNHERFNLSLYDHGRYMRLDAAAQRALNVMPCRGDANLSFSLYGLMNRARTAMGKRKLKVWLKQPLVKLDEINVRHDVVDAFVGDSELRERLRDQHLRAYPDIERLARKLETKRATLSDLCQLYRASAKLKLIEDCFRCHEGPQASLLCTRYADPLARAHDGEHLTKFEELLEAAIDLDRIPEEYLICSSYHPDLQRLREEKDAVEGEVDQVASNIARDLGLELNKSIKLEWHKASNQRTRCMRITQKEEKAVRSKLDARYTTIETRKDGTKFTNKALGNAAERLSVLSGQYEDLQKDLVEQVVSVAHTFVEVWEEVAAMLAEVDVLLGFADLAVNAPTAYVRPNMLPAEKGEVSLMGCRHPCVEAQDGTDFIKNDCSLVRGQSWFQIITGPNMGGKSTFIRQVGVNVLMAQVGCFVPCDEATICVRDAIFARVGAGDCQQRGVSTFMAEMLETAAILKGATERSLVIIDELGRGTSTYDGFGLAWAISEHIMETVGAPTLFATHFHELTELTGPAGVKNLHVSTVVEPTSGRLTMLYQIKEGPCDQSFGIQVAESANFPSSVVELAKTKLAELEGTETGLQAVGTKRKSELIEEQQAASECAKKFLKDFANLPVASSGPAALDQAMQMLRQLEEKAKENPTLGKMLEAC